MRGQLYGTGQRTQDAWQRAVEGVSWMVREGDRTTRGKTTIMNVSVTKPQKLDSGNVPVAYVDGGRDREASLFHVRRRTENNC